MIERPGKELYTTKVLSERITLAPGETIEARFKAWLALKVRKPYFCEAHSSTQLEQSHWFSEAYQGDERGLEVWDTKIVQRGAFHFTKQLVCPACRCRNASCPPEFHETSFDTFDTSIPIRARVLALCREFAAQVKNHRRGFGLFVGLPGTGKTRLACNIIRELERYDALYVRQGTLTCELRASYGRKDVYLHQRQRRDEDDEDEEPPTLLELLQDLRFLVLDEIGCTPLANDERLLLDELLKHRYDHGKSTIVISNLPLNGVREFLGDALYDRIRNASGGGKFILQFEGDSYRRTTGESYLQTPA